MFGSFTSAIRLIDEVIADATQTIQSKRERRATLKALNKARAAIEEAWNQEEENYAAWCANNAIDFEPKDPLEEVVIPF